MTTHLTNGNNVGLPVYFNIAEQNLDSVKLSEDRYEVFVDGKFVGEKTLYAQNEDFHDVGDFLNKEGFNNVQIEQNGDHILIHAANHNEAVSMRKVLEVYLKNR